MFTTSNQWELVGLTSYGIGCAQPAYSGVYTRVAVYQSWIATTTGGQYINAISSNPANITSLPSNGSSIIIQTLPVSHLIFLLFLILFYLS